MRKSLMMGLALLSFVNTAHAAPVLFDVNATFADGSVLTGSFDFDSSKFDAAQFSNVSLTLTGGSHFTTTFDTVGAEGEGLNNEFSLTFGLNSILNGSGPAPDSTRAILAFTVVPPASILLPGFSLEDFTGATLLPSFSLIRDFNVATRPVTLTNTALVSGSISETPLPAALPMFAAGLGMVGLFARRKKKPAAVAA
jgi:hypothetical protein